MLEFIIDHHVRALPTNLILLLALHLLRKSTGKTQPVFSLKTLYLIWAAYWMINGFYYFTPLGKIMSGISLLTLFLIPFAIIPPNRRKNAKNQKDNNRKKTTEAHPDKSNGNSEQFKLIKEAHDILSDEEKRKRYDEIPFKATSFNVLAKSPEERKGGSVHGEKTFKKWDKKINTWRNVFFLSLTINLLSIGFMVYLFNQYQIESRDNILLDDRLTSMIKENRELTEAVDFLKNINQGLQDHVDSLENTNQKLQGQVAFLQQENSKSVIVSSTTTESRVANNTSYLSLGMTEDQVIEIMGAPDKIQLYRWYYDRAWISFSPTRGRVNGWDNTSGILRVK